MLCLLSQKTGNQFQSLAIEYQLNTFHPFNDYLLQMNEAYLYVPIHGMISNIYCEKQGAEEWMADFFQLLILIHSSLFSTLPLALETNLYWIYLWAPRSSCHWMDLAREEPQQWIRGKESEIWMFVSSLPWAICITAPSLHDFSLPSLGNHLLSLCVEPRRCNSSIAISLWFPCIITIYLVIIFL